MRLSGDLAKRCHLRLIRSSAPSHFAQAQRRSSVSDLLPTYIGPQPVPPNPVRRHAAFVFILVLLEWGCEQKVPVPCGRCPPWFQSLFYWNWLSKQQMIEMIQLELAVSILLLLELALRPLVGTDISDYTNVS